MFEVIFIIMIGLVTGSFLTMFTYRFPRNLPFVQGRSHCPKCKTTISWYDNFPILSFILLQGKCRTCGKRIPYRYPLIEFSTAVGFLYLYFALGQCASASVYSPLCSWDRITGNLVLPFFLVLYTFMVAIFVIDFEHQIIADELNFILFSLIIVFLILIPGGILYSHLLAAFVSACFLLLLHLFTRGKGMGLGDVKFALPAGALLGLNYLIPWFFTAFLTGGIVGVILILGKRAKMRSKIAFGPFLVVALLITILWGNKFLKCIGLV